ncbi:hypothetical protein [Streptomyces goshikiensis]|uniref:hypothetical protein n=1 Tax=Streptomyces goshikiensis TaxID=1942 RepID=UPI00332C3096
MTSTVIEFVLQFLTYDREDVAEVLRQLEAVGVGQALDAHPAPDGARKVRLSIVWSAAGTTVVRTAPIGWPPPDGRTAPHPDSTPVHSVGVLRRA